VSTNVLIKKNDGGQASIAPEAVDGLRAQLRGALCLPGDEGYDKARTLWNAMIDRKPALIVRAQGASDVMASVNFARANGLLVAVKGGGHNIAGNACCDGGLMIDLSQMKSVRVDAKAKRARVEPGALLSDLDRETGAFGLATPLGINSTTGVAGLTLGGGFGWTSRRFGLTVDNLTAADVVTADGKLVTASESENADLFWAIRGGGGNFGVVTSFEYKLHEVSNVFAGLIAYPFEDSKALFAKYRDFVAKAPDELTVWVVLRKAPPLPFLPTAWHGKEIFAFAFCWSGDPAKGEQAIAPLRAFGTPVGEHMGVMPLAVWQTTFDPLLAPGQRNYWKSHSYKTLTDDTVDALITAVRKLPTDECETFVGHLGAAVNRQKVDATAYPHRDVDFILNIHTRWTSASQDKECIGWARELFDAAAKHATGGVYVNFMPEDETQRVKAGAYGANYERLAKIKGKYDPENLFQMNHNIAPELVS